MIDDNAEDDEPDQQVDEVDSGEEEVVGEEVGAVKAVAQLDLPDPLEHLETQEHQAEERGEQGVAERRLVGAGPGRLDAARHRPRAEQQNEGVENSDAQVQLRLGVQKSLGVWVR